MPREHTFVHSIEHESLLALLFLCQAATLIHASLGCIQFIFALTPMDDLPPIGNKNRQRGKCHVFKIFFSCLCSKMFLHRRDGMALSEQRLSNGLNDKGNVVRFPRETFLQRDQIGFEAHPASRLMGTGGWKAAQGLSMLDGLLSRRSCLSISNSTLLYKLLSRSLVDYACLV